MHNHSPLRMQDWTFSDDWAGHHRRYEIPELIEIFKKHGSKEITVIPYSYTLVRFYYYHLYLPFLKKRISKVKKTKRYNENVLKKMLIGIATKIIYLLFILNPLFKNNKPMNLLLIARKP